MIYKFSKLNYALIQLKTWRYSYKQRVRNIAKSYRKSNIYYSWNAGDA